MSLLDALFRGGHLRTLDHALAQSLRRLDPSTPDAVHAAAALASLAVAKGHAGLKLDAARELLDHDDADIAWPGTSDWHASLAASRWITTPTGVTQPAPADAPLVLEGDLLYLRRYREYESSLARGLQRIARTDITEAGNHGISRDPVRVERSEAESKHAPTPCDSGPSALRSGRTDSGSVDGASGTAALAPLFATLFPANARSEDGHAVVDHQARAAALALRHHLLLITGGPGTGKTTTVARMLVLLAAQAMHANAPPPRIALAAPTGRAAERMADSVRNTLQSLAASGIDPALLAALPTSGTTLHRLLGTIPDSPRFRHHADDPLPFDVVVVDEASMIDLPLMAKLVDAVADGTRLILLGDPDQLPSVEAGDVLAAILDAAGDGSALADDDAEALQPLLGGTAVPTSPAGGRGRAAGAGEGKPFAGRRVHLVRGWRQSESLQLGPLASAVREGDAGTALSLLRGGTLSNVQFHDALGDPLQAHRDTLLAHWQSLADATTPAEALARANRLRILTAVREGPQGARHLNARIEAMLSESGQSGAPGRNVRTGSPRHFHGQLLIVTENSYRHGLLNGDTGIVHRDADGVLMAWFPGADPAHPRAFHPAALPAHDSAFAMTVHKAQGSEFDSVWLLLPARLNRVLSRELVYTGITRARSELHVAGGEDVIREALSRHAGRWSGLGRRLTGS